MGVKITKPKAKTVDVEAKAGKAVVTKINTDKTEEVTEELVGETQMFTEPPCNVGVTAATTIPTGNYANVKLGVSLHIPCRHDEIDDVFAFAKEWVDGKMTVLTDEVPTE